MARTALKWILGLILSVIGFFIVGVVLIFYLRGNNSLQGLISAIVIGSVFFIPGLILLILALIDVSHNGFDMRIAKLLEEFDRITPVDLAKKAHSREDKIEKSVSRIIEKGLIIVYFDKATGEFVTQEGRAFAERVIGIVNSKRRVTLQELCDETGMTTDEVKRIIIGMEKRGLFHGTYDWKSGKILSREATKQLSVAKTACPNCGGKLIEPPLPGEEIKCEYCGQIITG
ncbi:MAG TPA: hypothetical protein VMX55_12905 [candidate division Zixibacteria bacterium]|nr:hypothetical protein [candidate division Zixibacteria bacterium]